MSTSTRCIRMNDIAIEASQSLPQEKVIELFNEVARSWTWEGKQLGRLEIIRDGEWIHINTYEKPLTQTLPY